MKRVAVTGATGFIGSHAVVRLSREPGLEVVPVTREDFSSVSSLAARISGSDAVLHLAGMNRGEEKEVEQTNERLAAMLADSLPSEQPTKVIYASTSQRHYDNPYGRSKRRGEEVLRSARSVTPIILEIPNVFGPGCRPFYNSVVATFCHQLTHGECPEVLADNSLDLLWVGDLMATFRELLAAGTAAEEPVRPGPVHSFWVTHLLEELKRLYDAHFNDRLVPRFESEASEHLYRTLLTYAEPRALAHSPSLLQDQRGYLFECVRQLGGGGQTFFSRTRPGIERGNHYHTRKYEKFCVVQGEATVRLRRVGDPSVLEYRVKGDRPTVVDIPVFYAHAIENVGDEDLLTIFWSNEVFDPADSDTHREGVVV